LETFAAASCAIWVHSHLWIDINSANTYHFGQITHFISKNSISNGFGFGSPSIDQTGSLPWVFQKQEYFQWAEFKNSWVVMAKSLVVRRAELSKFGGELAQRAAQYVRMSTIHQRYSIENQAAAIAAYAARYSLSIVRTYRDDGLSGLKIEKREGLKQLISDVCSGRADFSRVLVYDVSRWGRFQDVDESAHYEFLCRHAGIMVEYCAEQFDNDGSLLSSIVKNLKRVMAAEFSRELSAKVHAGQLHLAALGFRQGGPLGYGLCRELIDDNRVSKGHLKRGQQRPTMSSCA